MKYLFRQFLGKEQLLHKSVCDYLDYKYPDIFYFHPHNEAKRSPYERFLIKIMRLRPGMPDLLVPISKKGKTGMAMEFKIKPNKLTKNQLEIIDILNLYNWSAVVCYSFEEAKIHLDEYLNENNQKKL